MSLSIEGKTAIITGAANGVGLAIARHFIERGANVMLADRDEARLADEVGNVEDERGQARFFAGDLREKLTVANLVSATIDAFDRVDILINAARQVKESDPLDASDDTVKVLMEQNMYTALRLSQSVAKRMIEQAEEDGNEDGTVGAIVNLSSIAARRTHPDLLAYSVCPGVHFGTALIVDPKGELAAISRNQVIAKKHCVYWNPAGLHGLPQDRINPTGHIVKGSPTLVSDIRAFAHRMIGRSGGTNAVYFEETAERYLLPICLTLVMIHGVLRLPDLYDVLTALPGGGEAWLDFAFEMSESGIHEAIEVEKEIAKARGSDTGGFRGVAGELLKTFAALSDPLLRASVSPPYTFDLAELTASDDRFHLYLMPPAEFIGPWSPVIKAILSTAQTLKSRAPGAPRQTWMIDECAQLKNFGLIPELYSIGAGQGIRPVAVFPDRRQ